jgi:CheY-like chemotaxis protein
LNTLNKKAAEISAAFLFSKFYLLAGTAIACENLAQFSPKIVSYFRAEFFKVAFMPKKVLIVEDNQDTRSFMKLLIETYGYEVFEAEDGIEALDKYKEHLPDIILMDMSLPTVCGLTATKAIRELDASGSVPILAVTAFGKDYYDEAIAAGCNDLICKPVDFDALQPAIEKYLKK